MCLAIVLFVSVVCVVFFLMCLLCLLFICGLRVVVAVLFAVCFVTFVWFTFGFGFAWLLILMFSDCIGLVIVFEFVLLLCLNTVCRLVGCNCFNDVVGLWFSFAFGFWLIKVYDLGFCVWCKLWVVVLAVCFGDWCDCGFLIDYDLWLFSCFGCLIIFDFVFGLIVVSFVFGMILALVVCFVVDAVWIVLCWFKLLFALCWFDFCVGLCYV